jgi:N-methylhydantoinase B
MDGIDCDPNSMFASSGAYGSSLEVLETEYPVIHEYFRVLPDSGGPGRYRGGASLIKEVTFLAPADLTTRIVDRCSHPPSGLSGGKPGRGGGWIVNRGKDDEWFPAAKQTNIPVEPGTTVTMVVSGGGGYGNPFERNPEAVIKDVKDGFVSIEGARRDYGVNINPVTWVAEALPRTETAESGTRDI